jgi:hypothetical protein
VKRTLVALALALVCACKESEPEVEVQTFVGSTWAHKDPELSREAAVEVLSKALPEWWGTGTAAPAEKAEGMPGTVHPPRTKKQFVDLVTAIRKGPLDELGGPARRIAAADPQVWPLVKEALLAERKAPKGDYRSLLRAIGGDVPNQYGYFQLAWKKAHGFQVKLSTAWFEDLLALPRSKVSPGLLKVYRDCILETALLRAASKLGRHPPIARDVAETMLYAAYVHQGTFRDEVSRAMAAIGDEAVPHLIVLAISPSDHPRDEVKPEVKRARFARHSLDKMDRLHPLRATAAVRDDPRLLAQLLESYGVARPGEAAAVLLDFVDDRSPVVRKAARKAFEEYVVGPPPAVSVRHVRQIGGGTGIALAYLSYRERARIAIRERIEHSAPALLEDECELKREDGSWDKTCEEQPARLCRAYLRWLDLRRELDQTTKIDAALADADADAGAEALDRLLAITPDLVGRDRLVGFFEQLARQKRDSGDPERAAALFRKASMLGRDTDATHARTLHVAALQAEADLEALPRRGRLMLLRRAAELAPEDAAIAAAVDRIESEPTLVSAAAGISGNRLLGGAGILAVILFTIGLLGRPLRRRLRA